jgi:hypothetical protein
MIATSASLAKATWQVTRLTGKRANPFPIVLEHSNRPHSDTERNAIQGTTTKEAEMKLNWKHTAGAFALSIGILGMTAVGPANAQAPQQSTERNVEGGCTTPRCFKPGQAPNSNAKKSLNPPSYLIIDGHIYVLVFKMGRTDTGAPPPYNPMPSDAYYLSTLTGEFARVFDPGGKRMDWKKYGPGHKFTPGEVQILSDPEDAFIDVGATDYKYNFLPTDRSYYGAVEEIDTVLKVVRIKSKKIVKSFNRETGKLEYYNKVAVSCGGNSKVCGTGPVIILMLDKVKGRWIIPPFVDPNFIAPADKGLFERRYEIGPDGSLIPARSL